MARGRRERRRDQKSVVIWGRGRVEGPEAWRRMARVRMRSGRRGADVMGWVEPLFFFFFVNFGGVFFSGEGGVEVGMGKMEKRVLTRFGDGCAKGR